MLSTLCGDWIGFFMQIHADPCRSMQIFDSRKNARMRTFWLSDFFLHCVSGMTGNHSRPIHGTEKCHAGFELATQRRTKVQHQIIITKTNRVIFVLCNPVQLKKYNLSQSDKGGFSHKLNNDNENTLLLL